MSDRAEQQARRPRTSAPAGDGDRARAGGRLSHSAEFDRVYRHGRSTGNRHLVLYTFPNPAAERPRMGLSVSRRVGGATQRNRVKRLLREAWAGAQGGLAGGLDVVVLARPAARELAEREGLAGIDAALAELIDRARLRAPAGPPREAGGAAGEPPAGDLGELAAGELAAGGSAVGEPVGEGDRSS